MVVTYFYGTKDKSKMYQFSQESFDNLVEKIAFLKNPDDEKYNEKKNNKSITFPNQGDYDPIYWDNGHMIELNFPEMCGGMYNDLSTYHNPICIVMYVEGPGANTNEHFYLYEYDGIQYKLVMM